MTPTVTFLLIVMTFGASQGVTDPPKVEFQTFTSRAACDHIAAAVLRLHDGNADSNAIGRRSKIVASCEELP
jgi:hypothetical protein